jgi:ribonucleotide reductase beta subunit family protein with ferritin-like domain
MEYSIFPKLANDATKEPMFLGNNINVQRYDRQRFEVFDKLYERQISFFWRPEEIDLSRDRIDFKNNLSDAERHIFTSNLKYQTLLDSIQGRSPSIAFLPLVSIPELEEFINAWQFFECCAEGTEVLTTSGWKQLSACTTDDTVLVYDFDKETVFFEKPKNVFKYNVVDKRMVRFKASNRKQYDCLVTENHRMPYRTSRGIKKFEYAVNHDYQAHHQAPVSGNLQNDCGITLSFAQRILIAAQADGTWQPYRYNGDRCGTVPIWFSLTKQRKIDRLHWLCENANIKVRELTPDKKNPKKRRFKIDFPITYIPSDIKLFDSWVDLSKVGIEFCKDFLQELSHWDSHIFKETGTFTYTTTEKRNVDVVQALAVMCGKQARLSVIEDNRKASYKNVYNLNIMDRLYKDGQSINKSYETYTGEVACLETSTGAFVIRYNGVVSVTGNCIHSKSYTHIIRNVYDDPSAPLDDIMVNEAIMKRAEAIGKYYDDLIEYAMRYNLGEEVSMYELRRRLFLCFVCVNVLEAIRFYVSFACSFAFAERELMEGNAKIIKLIARDEACHLSATQTVLNFWRTGADGQVWADMWIACEDEIIEIFKTAVEQEKEWAEYLFKDGSMLGLNKEILCNYVEYITNQRMMAIGLPIQYPKATQNPITWINAWLSSDNVQVAPQEVEISSYLIGQIDSEVNADDLKDISI